MTSHRRNVGPCRRLLGGLLVLLLPAIAAAQNITIKNDLKQPVVVQAVYVVSKMLKRDKPYALKPGDSTPAIALPGDKVIIIYDAQNPNLILGQVPLQANKEDQSFAVVPIPKPQPRGPKVTLEKTKAASSPP
jgi:hypothetical protein